MTSKDKIDEAFEKIADGKLKNEKRRKENRKDAVKTFTSTSKKFKRVETRKFPVAWETILKKKRPGLNNATFLLLAAKEYLDRNSLLPEELI
jgi:hypothetical protein